MVQITIDDNLAQAISQAGQFITLIDSHGREIGQVTRIGSSATVPIGMTPEHIAELERRMREDDGTRIPFSEVIKRLKAIAPE
jgi:hypothetical protein